MLTKSSLRAHKESDSRKNPFVSIEFFTFHLKHSSSNEGRSSLCSNISRTFIVTNSWSFRESNSGNMHNRKRRMQVFQDHFSEISLLSISTKFPTSSFQEEAVNKGSTFSSKWYFIRFLHIQYVSLETHIIKW